MPTHPQLLVPPLALVCQAHTFHICQFCWFLLSQCGFPFFYYSDSNHCFSCRVLQRLCWLLSQSPSLIGLFITQQSVMLPDTSQCHLSLWWKGQTCDRSLEGLVASALRMCPELFPWSLYFKPPGLSNLLQNVRCFCATGPLHLVVLLLEMPLRIYKVLVP